MRARAEEGWILITSMVLMAVMLAGGAATYALVDGQTSASATQRQRESAFNLAEAAMNAQVFSLARDWPGLGAASSPYPVCGPSTGGARCPSSGQLAGMIPAPDTVTATWQTQVHDNGSAQTQSFYRDDLVLAQPTYDANGDGKLWVRSTATARGRTRTLVALVRAEAQTEDLPHAALITGRLDISNNGNKIIVDGSGSSTGAVAVRCTPQLIDLVPCLGHTFGIGKYGTLAALLNFLQVQIAGPAPITGYTGTAAMTPEARARLRAAAIAEGTWSAGCPASLTGRVVYIESGNCSYVGNAVYNSDAAPGLVILGSGSMYFGGTVDYHGVIYIPNDTASAATVMQVQGNATVYGGVLIDGQATTVAGSSKLNIRLMQDAFNSIWSYGSAGVIQNTWREIVV